jgi:hypothetical protein
MYVLCVAVLIPRYVKFELREGLRKEARKQFGECL